MAQLESNLGELTFHAEGGDVIAQYRLGVSLLLGERCQQDVEMAFRWLSQAAAAKHGGAQSLLPLVAALQPQAQAQPAVTRWAQSIGRMMAQFRNAAADAVGSVRAEVSRVLPILQNGLQLGPMLVKSVDEERRRHAPFVDAS